MDPRDKWGRLGPGKYRIMPGESSVAALAVTGRPVWETGFVILVGHLDSPGIRLRPREWKREGSYVRIPAEPYGSPLLHTWLDRPLRAAGRTGDGNLFETPSAVGIMPSLALHYDREANEKFAFDKATHLALVVADAADAEGHAEEPPVTGKGRPVDRREAPAKRQNRDAKDNKEQLQHVLDLVTAGTGLDTDAGGGCIEVSALPTARAEQIGEAGGLIAAPRIDNLAACHAIVSAMTRTNAPRNCLALLFDHEEIGSRTPDGADSALPAALVRRIVVSLGGGEEEIARTLARSYCISIDATHGVHPSFPGKHSSGYDPVVGGGPAIKENAVYRYTTTPATARRFQNAARFVGAPIQVFSHRSEQRAGSTVGPMVAAGLAVPSVDVGIPIWAMHSSVETASPSDQAWMIEILAAFVDDESL